MTRSVSVVEAKGQLSDLIQRAESGKERFLIRRHGKPAGALVSADDLAKLEALEPAHRRRGALATVGLLADVPEWEEIIEDVIKQRQQRMDREVDLE